MGIHDSEHAANLQHDLNEIGNWSNTWKLNFNVDKFALVRFHSKEALSDTSYSMNGTGISHTRTWDHSRKYWYLTHGVMNVV